MKLSTLFGLLTVGGLAVAGWIVMAPGRTSTSMPSPSTSILEPAAGAGPPARAAASTNVGPCERELRTLLTRAGTTRKANETDLATLVDELDAAFTNADRGTCKGRVDETTLHNLRLTLGAALLYAARTDADEGRHARAQRRRDRALAEVGDLDEQLQRVLLREMSLGLAMQAREDKDPDKQRALAEEAIEVWADNQLAHQLRSTACEALNDLPCALEAAEALKQLAPDLAGLDKRLEKLKRQASVEGGFKDVRSTHFVARYEGLAAERAGYAAMDILERAYIRVGDRLDRRPEQPITVVIYTGAQYEEATLAPDWTGGIFDGKIRLREGDLLREGGRLESVLFHEYTHALLARTVTTKLPIWLHEGLAQAMEPGFDGGRAERMVQSLGRAHPLSTLNGSFMTMKDHEQVALAYAQSALMVSAMLDSQGSLGLQKLFDALAGGDGFDEAFTSVYYKSPQTLHDQLFAR